MVKAISLISAEAANLTLKIGEYLPKGVDRLMGVDPDAPPAWPIDLERYARRKT